ncbi:hypothetical protein [Ensifer sesbaniae]|uniref:hypothetical protein n=1 Tax=Ensifer sesbaniae TaxID=1214071 RepID=UPI003D7FC5DE
MQIANEGDEERIAFGIGGKAVEAKAIVNRMLVTIAASTRNSGVDHASCGLTECRYLLRRSAPPQSSDPGRVGGLLAPSLIGFVGLRSAPLRACCSRLR